MIKNIFMNRIPVSEMFRGVIILNLILSPFTLFITLFIAIMGGGNPSSSGFLTSFGISVVFIYGAPLGVLIWLAVLGKISDFILRIVPITTLDVSCLGIVIAAVLFVVAGNVFVDNLYQFRQGNYAISFFALFFTLLYAVMVYFSGKIRISWMPI